jgi:hypothetical protein
MSDKTPGAAAASDDASQVLASSITTVAAMQAAFPALCSELAISAATAERTRIASIDAAAMPGHDAIIAAHKADPKKTAGDAALAMNAASRGKQNDQLAALDADENKVGDLKSEAGNLTGGESKASAQQIADLAVAYQTEQAAKGITIGAAAAVAHVSKNLKAV